MREKVIWTIGHSTYSIEEYINILMSYHIDLIADILVYNDQGFILTIMINYHIQNCKILFIGINPHDGSFRRGVPFSNNKMFWYLLRQSGIINETMEDLRNDEKLKEIYENKFNQVYRLGMLNMVDRPSNNASLLLKGEEVQGIQNILSAIHKVKPRVVCFVGKVTYQKFSGLKDATFGWQADIFQSKIYVMHFPIRGEASVRVDELKEIAADAFDRK